MNIQRTRLLSFTFACIATAILLPGCQGNVAGADAGNPTTQAPRTEPTQAQQDRAGTGSDDWPVVQRLSLGFEKDGVHLAIVNTIPNSAPGTNGLVISYDRTRRLVQTLNDLRGFVHIRTARDALKFVRLRLPVAFSAFLGAERGSDSVQGEIVEQCQLPDQSSAYTKYIMAQGSGFEGVLSHEAFVAGGFHRAHVTKLPRDFIDIRWTYSLDSDGKPHIARIREFVGFDGSYQATVLFAPKKMPKLPGTRWGCAGYA